MRQDWGAIMMHRTKLTRTTLETKLPPGDEGCIWREIKGYCEIYCRLRRAWLIPSAGRASRRLQGSVSSGHQRVSGGLDEGHTTRSSYVKRFTVRY